MMQEILISLVEIILILMLLLDSADADEASGIQLEAEAAAAYQKMAAAAAEDGVALVLTAGYQDADARSAAYETQKQQYLEKGRLVFTSTKRSSSAKL